jgi:hypothetical protein
MKSILLKITSLLILTSITATIHAEDMRRFVSLS